MSANEEAKALAMRKRFEERTKLFLNAKQRTIGIDKLYLDKQVHEKNQHYIQEREERIEEGRTIHEKMLHDDYLFPFYSINRKLLIVYVTGVYQEELCNYLKDRELLVRDERIKKLEDWRATLAEQVRVPKNNALGKCEPLQLESCGPSSIQRFGGEDNTYDSRKHAQKDQVRVQSWFMTIEFNECMNTKALPFPINFFYLINNS